MIYRKLSTKLFFSAMLLIVVVLNTHAASSDQHQYLDAMTDALGISQGWGNTGINSAASAPGATAMALRIQDADYARGIGHHAPGAIHVPMEGRYLAFEAEIGVQWQGGNRGSVVFEVWVDDERRYLSGVMTDSDAAIPIAVDLQGASTLRLVALDGGDGISCDMANWANARLTRHAHIPDFGPTTFAPGGVAAACPVEMEGSFALIGQDGASQFAFVRPLEYCTMITVSGERSHIAIPISAVSRPFSIHAEVSHVGGAEAVIRLSLDSGMAAQETRSHGKTLLRLDQMTPVDEDLLRFDVAASQGDAAVRLERLLFESEGHILHLAYIPGPLTRTPLPMPPAVAAHPLLEQELVEWDWRMQDGIGAGQAQSHYADAIEKTLRRGDQLLALLESEGQIPEALSREWAEARNRFKGLQSSSPSEDDAWEQLWRDVHVLRRTLVFSNPLTQTGPLVFVKQAPGVFSHQLTQYYGRYARPGGGVFALDTPGQAMATRQFGAGMLPLGSYMQPEVSHDGQRIYLAFCAIEHAAEDTLHGAADHYYHLYEMDADGARMRQLTDGPYDDFSPTELPDGKIMFISTRRGGWHRCGYPGCEVYTLTLMEADGNNIHTVSYHETQEWDPAVLNDGRVVYTRWDYVDRDAVHYQQLWVKRPDGTAPVAFYGNHSLNPVGVWEARPIPSSRRIMATAAAHHAMTAGSIILVDPSVGIDGLEPLTRLTPHVPFPESEDLLRPHWRSAVVAEPLPRTDEMDRWPGQCYRSPWPLSEQFFIAAYSFDPLIGEPHANAANMFGLYFVDAFGNKELVYRDLNISSLWPMPLGPRPPAPALPSSLQADMPGEGTFYLQNVYDSYPLLPDRNITHLRIVQVLPKSTPGANNPTVGAANASPGKQVLGTVPVEADGSAYFRAPAGISLAFQALDETGQAVQIMRSLTYLQSGETVSCVGCHEPRMGAPSSVPSTTAAMGRPPSEIHPGPDGSLPFSYPILVQPVLDRHCVRCHGDDSVEGLDEKIPFRLTGTPEGRYTESYNALVARVSYTAWGRGPFPEGNSEPTTQPGFFGAKGSALTHMLLDGHHDVQLEKEDWERLITWMDANALFYGTFNVEDQARQQRAERIAGPELE